MRCKRRYMHGKKMRRSPIRQEERTSVSESTSVVKPREVTIVEPKTKIQEYISTQKKFQEKEKEESKVYSKSEEQIKALAKRNALIGLMKSLGTTS